MNLYDIRDQMKWKVVNQNLADGTVKIEQDLVFDLSHVMGNNSFTVVETVYEKGKKVKKRLFATYRNAVAVIAKIIVNMTGKLSTRPAAWL